MYGYIECPHCGYERKGNWDDTEDAPFEDMEYQCEKCGKWFLVDCIIEYLFEFPSRKN